MWRAGGTSSTIAIDCDDHVLDFEEGDPVVDFLVEASGKDVYVVRAEIN